MFSTETQRRTCRFYSVCSSLLCDSCVRLPSLRQLFQRHSFRELLQVVAPLLQEKSPSFRQVMAAASSLVCGYTEGAFSRVTSFNWYEDNNYKAFLGINGGRAPGGQEYDNSTSETTAAVCGTCGKTVGNVTSKTI